MPYNTTPNPLAGTDQFGKVPGTVDLPNPAGDLAQQLPGLSGINSQIGQTINQKLAGNLSPATIRALQDASARFGLSSGMAGGRLGPSGLALNNLFGNIAGFSEKNAQQGIEDYNSVVPTISHTQTVSPELQAGIADQNAVKLAAPNPRSAQMYAEQLFNKYLAGMRGAGGAGGAAIPSPGGGSGSFTRSTSAGQDFGPTPVGRATNPVEANPNAGANWAAWNSSMPWNRSSGTGTNGLNPNDWHAMIQANYPELAGASPEDLAALGINPWDAGWAGSQGGGNPGTFYAGNGAGAPAFNPGGGNFYAGANPAAGGGGDDLIDSFFD